MEGARDGRREEESVGQRRTAQLPLDPFLFVHIKRVHSLGPTPLANVNATSLSALNVSHMGQMVTPSQCSQCLNK